ncbi:GNAT family N-acetyltransferase [Novosphingobium soli]|uniref:GNAT family N-acetyltransferase n=1 Tax=Novosphingobium soli TaxID=574956 RepID=A0ABV6CWX7_9SPHN
METPSDEDLREAAAHRGFRLVRSRRRKPGVGDYGKLGLADGEGKPVFGFGPDGLTASAAQVAAFLRSGEVDTWRKSAALGPAAPPSRKTAPPAPAEPPARRRRRAAAAAAATAPAPRKPRRTQPARAAPPPPKPSPQPSPEPKPQPEPLRIGPGKRADVAALAQFLSAAGLASSEAALEARIAALLRPGSGLVLARRGAIVGCAAWSVVPALHRPPVGRLSTLFVAARERRRGVGRALLDAVRAALPGAGCTALEVMSDIEIRNAHGFFRRMGLAQASYRFAAPLEPAGEEPGR